MAGGEALLEGRGLGKRFGEVVAVDGVSVALESGRILGLLGPNGAGKTTTVAMLAGLVTPDAGDVLVGGRRLAGDVDPAKRRLGLVPQDLALYDELSARENLKFSARCTGWPARRWTAPSPRCWSWSDSPSARATAWPRTAAG